MPLLGLSLFFYLFFRSLCVILSQRQEERNEMKRLNFNHRLFRARRVGGLVVSILVSSSKRCGLVLSLSSCSYCG